MSKRVGPALWFAAGISFIFLGYQNCDFLGPGLEPYSSENSLGPGGNSGSGGDGGGGNGDGNPGTSIIYGVSASGLVTGCARSEDFPDETLRVTFYANGAAGMGERLGEALANGTLAGGGCANHRFTFQIPDNYRDGAVHQLFAYAGSEAADGLIGPGPRAFAAYDFSDEGRAFFEANLRTLLSNSCNSCHGPDGRSPVVVYDYETAFGYLVFPTPFEGATDNTNALIAQINGSKNHSGGNFCGGGSAVCNQLKAWWAVEFQ